MIWRAWKPQAARVGIWDTARQGDRPRPVFKGWLTVACLLVPLSSLLPERIERPRALVDKPVESSVQVQGDPEECPDLRCWVGLDGKGGNS